MPRHDGSAASKVSKVYIDSLTQAAQSMGHKLKITGWIALGVMAGSLTTVSLQTFARGTVAPLPLEELQQLAMAFSIIKDRKSVV